MAINKIPKNYYSDTNIRRDKINEIIDEVNDIASIPSPSAADAGKVVKVSSEGSYELAQDAGAKELVITLASDFTANKTYNEILAALNRGDIVKLVTWSEQKYIYSGMFAGLICFACIRGSNDSGITNVDTIAVDDTNNWEQLLDNIEHLPSTTSADAGKVLTVGNNGAWELDDVPKEVNIIEASINPSNHTITFNDTIANVCNSILNHEITVIRGFYESVSYNMIYLFKVNFIDTYDNTIYCDTTQFQANSCTIYGFTIKPSLSGNSTTYYQKKLAFAT